MDKITKYPASCSTCIFVGNGECQKGWDDHITYPKTWDLKQVVCSAYKTDTFMIDLNYVTITISLNSPCHYELARQAKKERRRIRRRKFFGLKLKSKL